jgi:hypothetical protein
MENFYSASKPFVMVAKFMGIFPVKLQGKKFKNSSSLHFFDVIVTLTWFFLQLLLFILIVVVDKNYENSKILSRVWKILNAMEFSFMIFNFCYQIIKRKSILKFLVKIQEVDEMVKLRTCLRFWC